MLSSVTDVQFQQLDSCSLKSEVDGPRLLWDSIQSVVDGAQQ